VKEILPDAVYTPWSKVGAAIERAVKQPPKAPMTPRLSVKGLPAKLGIHETSVVAMLHTPERSRWIIPQGVRVQKQVGDADVVMLFRQVGGGHLARTPCSLGPAEKGSAGVGGVAERGAAVKSDLTLVPICEMARPYGLAAVQSVALWTRNVVRDRAWGAARRKVARRQRDVIPGDFHPPSCRTCSATPKKKNRALGFPSAVEFH